MPKLTPHVPGPVNILRLATCGSLKRVAPNDGRSNALGSQIWLPFFLLGLPTTIGRINVPLKSPTASSAPLPTLPGTTGSQLSQVQKGVNPVPVLANMLKLV